MCRYIQYVYRIIFITLPSNRQLLYSVRSPHHKQRGVFTVSEIVFSFVSTHQLFPTSFTSEHKVFHYSVFGWLFPETINNLTSSGRKHSTL